MEMDFIKEQLISLVESLEEEDGMDLSEVHPLFKWTYKDWRPHIQFQLMIVELDEADEMKEEVIH